MTDRAIRVLLIDGQVEDTHWVEELLADLEENRFAGGWQHGVEMFPIGRLADALKILEDPSPSRLHIDALLLNPNLPDSAGLHTLIKLLNRVPDIPVVILADVDDPDLAVSMLRAGAQDFLAKTELDSIPLARALRLAVERGRILRDLRATSSHDELTGLLNRNGFSFAARQDQETARRMGLTLAVVTVEVCGMDRISMRYGREEGHLALMETADALRNAVSIAHLPLARTASNRFAFCVLTASRNEANSVIAGLEGRLRLRLHKANRGSITVRTGVAWLGEDGVSEDLLGSAERSLCENMGEIAMHPQQFEHKLAALPASNSA